MWRDMTERNGLIQTNDIINYHLLNLTVRAILSAFQKTLGFINDFQSLGWFSYILSFKRSGPLSKIWAICIREAVGMAIYL